MKSSDCQECAHLREQSATLYADYVAARDDLAMTKKGDSLFRDKAVAVRRLRGVLNEAHRAAELHRNSHSSENSH